MSSRLVSANKDFCLQVIIASTIGVSVTMLGTPGVGPSSLILGNITRPIAISLQIRLPGLATMRVSFEVEKNGSRFAGFLLGRDVWESANGWIYLHIHIS